ncbi:MAG: hypothetical protein ACREON_06195 [Gemmatimonadaceae bacterium]
MSPAEAQRGHRGRRGPAIGGVAYSVTFDSATARERTLKVGMTFSTSGRGPVLLSVPAWTPGAYELSYFARWVSNVTVSGDGKSLAWDKADHDTWRLHTNGARDISITFDVRADSLDNAMAWSRDDFAFFNGTTVFPYPEGEALDFAATVTVNTMPAWWVATGMPRAGAPHSFRATSYHDLVDMPFFVGRFDYDSALVSDKWVRLATYPARTLTGASRARLWDQLKRMIPPQIAVFRQVPFDTYTTLIVFDSAYGGASALEHQNSHLGIYSPFVIGSVLLPSITAHEIFHAWNVKRLRPAELWPYRYDEEQPTPLLWVSEGITDYYADLALVRGGVIDSTGFFGLTAGKISEIGAVPPVALEDASLSTWVHPVDGTGYLYYPKGSLVGLIIDILIRDASDNRASLDDLLRRLYEETYLRDRGFTTEQFWRTATAVAGGKDFGDVYARYVDGREPLPWNTVLPLAGLRLITDTLRQPSLGVTTLPDSAGILVTAVDSDGAVGVAGVQPGDYLISIGDIPVDDQDFGTKFRSAFGTRAGVPLPIRVRRDGEELALTGEARVQVELQPRIVADPAANAKAARIRAGILRGGA